VLDRDRWLRGSAGWWLAAERKLQGAMTTLKISSAAGHKRSPVDEEEMQQYEARLLRPS